MKKLTLMLAVVSALTLTACNSGTDTAETSTTTAATTTDDGVIVCHDENCFFTYNKLMEGLYERYPDAYECPLSDTVQTWDFSLGQIRKDSSGMGNYYILDFDDTVNNAHITLYVHFETSYENINDMLAVNFISDEVEIQNDRCAYVYYPDDGTGDFRIAAGLAGDQNAAYQLTVQVDGTFTNSADVLKEYIDLLEL